MQVVFEAILSDSTNSWLAVDDIVFDLEPCPHPGKNKEFHYGVKLVLIKSAEKKTEESNRSK